MSVMAELLGEDLANYPLGEDLAGPDLIDGWIPGRSIEFIPPMQLGDGLAGPPNDQQFQIYRDNRPIPADSVGMLVGGGPSHLGIVARHRAGRQFPLNYEWNAGLDQGFPGMLPQQDALYPSPLYWGQAPGAHDGVPPTELLPPTRTVFYTASPRVGWAGYG